jgi:hypothetical protein
MMKEHMERHEQGLQHRSQDIGILNEIGLERVRQDAKWGEQNHPDGTNNKWTEVATGMKLKCDSKSSRGQLTFRDIFEEEIWEAYSETDPDLLRAELVQCAAVLVNWIGAIDRRKKNDNEIQELVE